MADILPIAVPATLGLLGLLFAPAVDRWAGHLERWVNERLGQKGQADDGKWV